MLNTDELDARQNFGEQLVRIAGDYVAAQASSDMKISVSMKGVQDWVTNVDCETETLIRGRLADAFPDDNILGEEQGGIIKNNTWVIDPIDGTINFSRGSPLWCVSVSFIEDGLVALGFIYAPLLNQIYVGRRNKGAWLNGKLISRRSNALPSNSQIELGWIRQSGFGTYSEPMRILVQKGYEFLRLGTGALSLAWVAAGKMDGYAEKAMNIWDGGAGWLMVREAGGVVNQYDENCLSAHKADIVAAANGLIFDHLIQSAAIDT